MAEKRTPVPPGEILQKEFMIPLKLSQNKLARDIDVPVGRINEILKARRAITTDTALRLGIYFGTTPEFWLNLQNRYDLKCAKKTLLPKIKRCIRPFKKKVA